MKNLWPIGIITVLVVFAGGLAVFVRAALHQPDQLVREDYYDHEIAYQQHIDRELRAADVKIEDVARFVPGTGLVITLPAGASNGVVGIFRPSAAGLDRTVAYAPGPDGRHIVPASNLLAGTWRARLAWHQGGEACYKEALFQVTP